MTINEEIKTEIKEDNLEQTNDENLDEVLKEKEEKCSETAEKNSKEAQNEDKEEINIVEVLKEENLKLSDENTKLNNQLEALKDRIERTVAEYDNYRKRTVKEKEGIYDDACEDVLKNMFPVLDNLERAIAVDGSVEDLKKGIEMTIKQFKDSFDKLGVQEIPTENGFDPNFHNAVMHVDDDNYKEQEIVEVFQKGYMKENKVLRYSMVKVAN